MWYLALALLAVFAVVILLLARRQQLSTLSTLHANKAVYESRLQELDEDKAQGLLNDKDLANAQRELKKTFVTDVHNPDEEVRMQPARITWVALLALVAATALYVWGGSWQQQQQADTALAELEQRSARLLNNANVQPDAEEMMLFALGLRQRLAQEPNASAWSLYGRIMLQVGQLEEALAAFEQSRSITPSSVSNLMYYAQALILSGSDADLAKAGGFIGDILREDRTNVEALGLLGVVAYERGDFDRAAQAWEITVRLLDEEDPRRASLLSSIEDAKARSDGSLLTLTVNVDISEAMRNELAFGATLFVFVRDPDGGRAPIAVSRRSISDFPVTITLTDADAVMTETGLSDAENWLIGARITRSGTIEMQKGDMEARPVLVAAEPNLTVPLRITEIRQ